MNELQLIGRLTKDPDFREAGDNKTKIARFILAVDRPFSKEQGNTADFIPITVFGTQAENCKKYLEKGRQVAVVGRLVSDIYKDAEKKSHFSLEVIADRVEFLANPNKKMEPQVDAESEE